MFRLRRKKAVEGEHVEPAGLQDAKKAVENSEQTLAVVEGRASEVIAVVRRLREIREVNHLDQRVRRMLQQDRPEGRAHGS